MFRVSALPLPKPWMCSSTQNTEQSPITSASSDSEFKYAEWPASTYSRLVHGQAHFLSLSSWTCLLMGTVVRAQYLLKWPAPLPCRWVVAVPFCVALPFYLALFHDLQLGAAAGCIVFGMVIMPPSQVRDTNGLKSPHACLQYSLPSCFPVHAKNHSLRIDCRVRIYRELFCMLACRSSDVTDLALKNERFMSCSAPASLHVWHSWARGAGSACNVQERMPGFLRMRLWDCWRRYFSMRAITPPLPYLSKHRNYMLVQFPHATCPLACWLVLGMAGLPIAGERVAQLGAEPIQWFHTTATHLQGQL